MKLNAVKKFVMLAVAVTVVALCPSARATTLSKFLVVTNTDYATAALGGLKYSGGSGTFSISGLSGTVTKAYLYWHGPLNSSSSSGAATLNGQAVTGTSLGLSSANCWFTPVTYSLSQAFRADVSTIITGNGSYTLAVGAPLTATVNGASLIIIYDDGNPNNNRDVYIFDGNDSNNGNVYDPNGWLANLTDLNYTEGQPGYLQLHVSDAQQSDLSQGFFFDDGDLQLTRSTPAPIQNYLLAAEGSVFNGNVGSYGGVSNLWDVSTWDISAAMKAGVNNLALSTDLLDDCLSLVVAIVDLPKGTPPPPPPPNNFAPVVTCSNPVAVDCSSPSGQSILLGANISDQDGNELSVIWRVRDNGNGTTVQAKTETIPAGSPTTSASVSLTYNFVPGSYLVSVTVSDGLPDHDQTCTTTVTVTSLDTVPPTITQCASDVTLVADAVNGQASVPDFRSQITAADNCTPVNALIVTQSPAAGTVIGTGIQNVTISVRDGGNNITTCVVHVTVVDQTPPIITTCAPGIKVTPVGSNANVPNFVAQLLASDNVTPSGSLVITQSPAAGSSVGIGITSVTLTVTDAAGNFSTCTAPFEVSLGDIIPPVIVTCAPPATADAGAASGTAAVPNLTGSVVAIDLVTPVGSLVITQSPAAGTVVGIGVTTVTITVKDAANNASTCTTTFTVRDQTAPVITTCAPPASANAGATDGKAAVPNFVAQITATDNSGAFTVTQTPAAGTLVGVGMQNVSLSVKDAAGNTSNCSTTFTVTDITPPVINCGVPLSATGNGQGQGAVPDATTQVIASDNVTASGSLIKTQSPTAGTLVGIGPHPIVITVADAAGNRSTCTIIFTVIDTTPPVITTCVTNVLINAGTTGQAVVPDVRGQIVATDNSGEAVIIAQNPVAGTLLGPGTFPITLTVSDQSGNSAICTALITVNAGDTVPPVIITCAKPKSASASSTTGTAANPNFVSSVSATDDRPGTLVITQSPAAGVQLPIGVNPVVITVKDAAGNVSTCTTTFTVVDCTDPVITKCAEGTNISPTTNGKAPLPDFTSQIQARDNSGAFTVTQYPDAGTMISCSTTVKIKVTDASGNSDCCYVCVTVKDTEPPVILTCAPSVTITVDSRGNATIPDLLGSVNAIDGSGYVKLSQAPKSGTCVDVGTYNVVIKAKDGAGNYSTCTATVTVVAPASTKPSVDCSVAVGSLWPPNHDLVNVGFKATGKNYTGSISVKVYSNLDDTSSNSSKCGGDRDDGDDDDDDGGWFWSWADWSWSYSQSCNYWSKNKYCDSGYNENESCDNFSPDAKNIGTGSTLRLRSERPGTSTGRVYLIVATVTNSSGKTATCTSTVVVPHDQSAASIRLVNERAEQAAAYYAGYGRAPSGYYMIGDGRTIGPKQ